MVEEVDFKQWRDAGHVARRTLEGIKGEIVAGKTWNEVIDSAERFIRRHGGQAAFPVTISVNDIGALNKKGKVWLFLSSLINLIVKRGTANNIRNDAIP